MLCYGSRPPATSACLAVTARVVEHHHQPKKVPLTDTDRPAQQTAEQRRLRRDRRRRVGCVQARLVVVAGDELSLRRP